MFGFSFINCNGYSELNCPPCDNLSVCEVTPIQLTSSTTTTFKRYFKNDLRLHLRRLAEKSITQSITEHSRTIQRSFIRHFGHLIDFPDQQIHSATFDFGVERALEQPSLQPPLISFLKSLAGPIVTAKFPILLPLRIPAQHNVSGNQYRRFLNNLVISNVAFSIDIHPHELAGKDFSPEKFLHILRFDIGLVRFIYEPEIGNHLVPKAITPWLDYLKQIAYRGDIIFCPTGGDNELFEQEYHNTSQLSEQIKPSLLD